MADCDSSEVRDYRESLKRQAAEHGVELVCSGMRVGLGTGSTALFAVRALARAIEEGRLTDVVGFPTSLATAEEARRLAIPLMSDDLAVDLDLTIDGADEVGPGLALIKGGGGALLREKIAAQASRRLVIVVDESKLSPRLGTRFALPVEVLAFGLRAHVRFLESLGATVTLRRTGDGEPFRSDSGNLIVDCAFGPIPDPEALARALGARAGIVEHGLFLGLTNDLIIAAPDGVTHTRR